MKFTIALCTRNRPQMLSACIKSVQSLVIPANCQLHLVVVENNVNPECESLVHKLMKATPDLSYTYVQEKKLGLSTARNTSVDVAIETNPNWICFIDDDQTVWQSWLNAYREAIKTNSADVFTGPVNYTLPENILDEDLPTWYKMPSRKYNPAHLESLDSTGAGNTIAKVSYFNGQPDKFRFDDKFQFTGGEDSDLFIRLKFAGAVIRFVEGASVNEVIASDRIRIKWFLAKEFSKRNLIAKEHINVRKYWDSDKYRDTTLQFIREVIKRTFSGLLFLIWGILICLFSKRALRYIVKGLSKICWVIGVFSGLARINFNLYKNSEGN